MNVRLFSLSVLASILSLLGSGWASAQDCSSGGYDGAYGDEVLLPQNWSCDERQAFWYTDQGSEIIPYSWFLHLEQADSSKKFIDPENIDRYRYLPQKPTPLNPDGLPIGFTRGSAAVDTDNSKISSTWLGMNCSACHTGQIEYDGVSYLIDGAPAMADFQAMFEGLALAMRATLDDSTKFKRFADAVIAAGEAGSDASASDREVLYDQLEIVTARREAWNERNRGDSPYGHGRLDAVGAIFNEVAAQALGMSGNVKPANAPVSYPSIWDTPQHDRVQWNGSIINTGFGALVRNVGEVLGVFGALELDTDPSTPTGHRSSIDMNGLETLEDHLLRLWSPRWDDTGLPEIDPVLAAKGRADFEAFCIGCHHDIDRADPARRIKATMHPVANPKNPNDPDALRTDPTTAANFLKRTASSIKLTGKPVRYLDALSGGKTFHEETEDATPTTKILGYTVFGTIANALIEDPKATIDALKVGQPALFQNAVDQSARALFEQPGEVGFTAFLNGLGEGLSQLPDPPKAGACAPENEDVIRVPCYKARPLNGIWATAPYLHNGSVRTLRELLLPADQRAVAFNVGSRAFDPETIGFVNQGSSTLDTRLPGNANSGHDGPKYGNDIFADDSDRMAAILEYLKTL